MNLECSGAGPEASRRNATVNRRKARAPKRAASGDDAELLDRHRQEALSEQPRPQPQHRLFQGRTPQSLAGMRRLKNAPPPQVLAGKRKRHASTWLAEFVKDLPQSPFKEGDRAQLRESSKERSPSPLQPLNGARSLGPPNAEFLGLGPVPKKRRSAGMCSSVPAAVKPEDKCAVLVNLRPNYKHPDQQVDHKPTVARMKGWQSPKVTAVPGDEQNVDAFTAIRSALNVQHGSPRMWVKTQHVQQLLDTLKAFQALLGCQGIAVQQGKLPSANPEAVALRLSAGFKPTASLPHAAPHGLAGAEQGDPRPVKPVLYGASLQQLLRPSSTLPVSQPARTAHQTGNAFDTPLPTTLEQLRSLTFFKRLDEQRPRSAACNGISVPVQQSLPAMRGAEPCIQADTCTLQGNTHLGSAVPEDLGQAPSCRPLIRGARSPADGGALITS